MTVNFRHLGQSGFDVTGAFAVRRATVPWIARWSQLRSEGGTSGTFGGVTGLDGVMGFARYGQGGASGKGREEGAR